MSEIVIKQLLDGETPFYPQTDIHGLVNNGEYAIDDVPTIDSSNLVTSGGVASELALGAVYDVTAHNGSAQFASLQALLTDSNLNTLIPTNIRRGGMSIKFIHPTPATYTVVKTEGVETQPTGTEVQEALSLNSGTYTAAQMTGVTPPASGSVTYYLVVTETVDEQEITTYTTWVITKVTSDDNKYVQYILNKQTWSIDTNDWEKINLEGEIVTLENNVDDIESILEVSKHIETLDVQYTTTNQYIANYRPPQINSNNNYRLSNCIHFDKDDTILYTGSTGETNVVLVARFENNVWTKLLVGNSSETTQSLEYTVTDKGGADVYFCWCVNKRPAAVIQVKKMVTTSCLDEIKQAIEEDIPALEQAVEDISEEVFTVVNDDITTGYVDNKYINKSGGFTPNGDWAYKEFQVKAGAKITFSVSYTISNVAALAQKYIPNAPNFNFPYKCLVVGASYTSQTVEYTATENMTVAVTFNKKYTRSIKIETPIVSSNVANIDYILTQEGQKQLVQDCDFGFMFNKIAVIGDSLASGRVEGIVSEPDAQGKDYLGFSWLSFLSKRWRCNKYRNYSRAGQHTSDWITEWLPVMQADPTIYDAYFIALGTNNEYNESNPIGDQENYEAFVDRYNDIIDAVRTKAPHAVIFLMSLYEGRAGNDALEDIAESRMETDKGIYYIDYANKAKYFRCSPEVNWRGHFSSTGYAYVASAINQIVNEIIWENQTEEFWQQFAKWHNIDNNSGGTSRRPSASVVGVGFTYYDTTLGKMIMSNGTTWVNLDGSSLS